MDSKASLDRKNTDKIYWLLDNYNEFEKLYSDITIICGPVIKSDC